jgi:hypothetical protein
MPQVTYSGRGIPQPGVALVRVRRLGRCRRGVGTGPFVFFESDGLLRDVDECALRS